MRDFERLGVLHENAVARRDAGARHHCGRCREAERARAGDHQHRHRAEQRLLPVARGEAPCGKRDERDHEHHRHEHRAHLVHQFLDRRLCGLRILDQADDAREGRLSAHRAGLDDEQAFGVDRAAGDAIALGLRDRQALAGDQRFVDVACALAHLAVHRDALARAHHHDIANAHRFERHLALEAVAAHARDIGTQRLERADRLRRLALGARLEPFSEQHQRDDDRRSLEIQVHAVPRPCEHQVHRQSIGGARAERDQQVHVARARAQRLPAGAVETPPEPELHRRGERELHQRRQRPVVAEERGEHLRGERRGEHRGERDRPPFRESIAAGFGARGGLRCRRRLVARGGDRLRQRLHPHPAAGLDARALGGEVHRHAGDAGHAGERLFDAPDARGAAHAPDCQIDHFRGAFPSFDDCSHIHHPLSERPQHPQASHCWKVKAFMEGLTFPPW